MKVVSSDGREMTVRDAGPVLVRVSMRSCPIKRCGTHVISDDEARAIVRELVDAGLYDHEFYRKGEDRCP